MNKAKLVEKIAAEFEGVSKKQVEQIINSITNTIIEELVNGGEVTIAGFGTFETMTRHARGGVDPRNPSQRIEIPAVKVAKFRTGKNIKDALKSK
jgi:DNA-binding protein HU-beta